MSEINHIKISLVLIPESYDYGIEDIVYRIYEKNQLIIERSMPQLNYNQAIVDTFFLSYDILKNCKQYDICVINQKNKKIFIKDIIINDHCEGTVEYVALDDYTISIKVL